MSVAWSEFEDVPGLERARPHGADVAAMVARSYEDVTDEVDVVLTPSSGALPRGLEGVYFRNGPGALGVGSQRYSHPFDGDGMVARFELVGGQVRYRNRFVRTQEFVEERGAGRMLHRGFGTQLPGGALANAFRVQFKNAANTSVISHGGRLLALWEGGLPHELDPVTLETLGRHDFDGALRNDLSAIDARVQPGLPFSAHPSLDADTGQLFNFGLAYGTRPRLMLYTVEPDGRMSGRDFVELDGFHFTHDSALTRSWRVFILPPVRFQLARALAGLAPPAACLAHDPDAPLRIMLVDRHDPSRRVTLPADPGFVFHIVNAFEDERGRVIVDALNMPSIPSTGFWRALISGEPAPDYPRTALTRYRVDPARGRVDVEVLSRDLLEFPTTDAPGASHSAAWFVAAPDDREVPCQSALARFDASTGRVSIEDLFPEMPGEPVFVADPSAPGRGWVLSVLYDAREHRSSLGVFDAQTLEVLARVPLPHHLPPGFHGTFVPRASRANHDGPPERGR